MLHSLPADQASAIAGRKTAEETSIRTLRAHEPLIFEGDDAEAVYEVLEGVVRVYKLYVDGRRQIISFAFPGDIVGLGQERTYSFGCDALAVSRVRVVPKGNLLRMVRERPEYGAKVLDVAFRELSAARDLSMVLCRKSAIEKVASFLCSLAERRRSLGPTGMMSLPMTRSDIADYLGLSIETVSRNITKLRVKRIISLPRAGLVLIHDMDRLKRIGDCETDRE